MRPLARLLCAIATLTLAGPAVAAPAIWEVRDDDSAIWLFGSISSVPEGMEWHTQFFDDLLAGANKVVFESDTGREKSGTIGAAALAHGLYTDGTLLTDLLDSDTELTLRQAVERTGAPFGVIQPMRPWFAASVIYVGTQVAYGFGDPNVADQIQSALPSERRLFLETIEEALSLMDDIPDDEQLAMLDATLAELDTIPKKTGKLASNWAAGTPENVAKAFLWDASGFSQAFAERVVYPRHRRWVGDIEAMLRSNQENLIIVGTANLIGDQGLIDLLSDAGYSVERVQ